MEERITLRTQQLLDTDSDPSDGHTDSNHHLSTENLLDSDIDLSNGHPHPNRHSSGNLLEPDIVQTDGYPHPNYPSYTGNLWNSDLVARDGHVHRNHHLSTGNSADSAFFYVHPVMFCPWSTSSLSHQFNEFPGRIMLFGNYDTIANRGLDAAYSYYFNSSSMFATPPRRILPVSQSNLTSSHLPTSVNRRDIQNRTRQNRVVQNHRGAWTWRRRDTELAPETYYNLDGSVNSREVDLQGQGSGNGIQSRLQAQSFQHESAFVPFQNCILPGFYVTQHFQLARNDWLTQFGYVVGSSYHYHHHAAINFVAYPQWQGDNTCISS